MKILLLSLLTILFSSQSFAGFMSEQKSKCITLADIDRAHDAWKDDFNRFQEVRGTLDLNQRYNLEFRSAFIVVNRMNQIQRISGDNSNSEMISDMNSLIRQNAFQTRGYMANILNPELIKFEKAISEALFTAQINFQCDRVDVNFRNSMKAAQ